MWTIFLAYVFSTLTTTPTALWPHLYFAVTRLTAIFSSSPSHHSMHLSAAPGAHKHPMGGMGMGMGPLGGPLGGAFGSMGNFNYGHPAMPHVPPSTAANAVVRQTSDGSVLTEGTGGGSMQQPPAPIPTRRHSLSFSAASASVSASASGPQTVTHNLGQEPWLPSDGAAAAGSVVDALRRGALSPPPPPPLSGSPPKVFPWRSTGAPLLSNAQLLLSTPTRGIGSSKEAGAGAGLGPPLPHPASSGHLLLSPRRCALLKPLLGPYLAPI